jgi:hypothetical protein
MCVHTSTGRHICCNVQEENILRRNFYMLSATVPPFHAHTDHHTPEPTYPTFKDLPVGALYVYGGPLGGQLVYKKIDANLSSCVGVAAGPDDPTLYRAASLTGIAKDTLVNPVVRVAYTLMF